MGLIQTQFLRNSLIVKLIVYLLKLIEYFSPLGFIFWFVGLILFIPWTEKITAFSSEKILDFKQILLISMFIIFISFLNSRTLLKLLTDKETASKIKSFSASLLLILAIGYKIYSKNKTRTIIPEIEGIFQTEGKIFPYIDTKRLLYETGFSSLSMPSHSTVALCHDGQKWIYAKTDKYGFLNENDNVWKESKILLLGNNLVSIRCQKFPEKVINLSGKGDNIIISLMKMIEFAPEKISHTVIIMTGKDMKIKDLWNGKIIELYIKNSKGQNMKENIKSLNKMTEKILTKKIREYQKSIINRILKKYEDFYKPYVIAELFKKMKGKYEITDEELEITKFIIKKIDELSKQKGGKTTLIFVNDEKIKNNEKVKEILSSIGVEVIETTPESFMKVIEEKIKDWETGEKS